MAETIITISWACADFLLAWGYHNDPQAQMTTAEVMTVALGQRPSSPATRRSVGSFSKTMVIYPPCCPKARLNRRPHQIPEALRDEAFRGKIASKHRYFYGLRVHLVVTKTGQPVQVALAPDATADIRVF